MDHNQLHAELMSDPAFASEWNQTKAARIAGNQLIAIRAWCGLSQAQLAKRAGMRLSYVRRIEKGDYAPNAERIAWIVASARRGGDHE